MNIITGEKIQQMCDIYFGLEEDFHYNPIIRPQITKQIIINNFNSEINNPRYIFCYSHRIKELSKKINLLKNRFILITHNSDGDITESPETLTILNSANLDKWYAQNICIDHFKLFFLPIGIANSQWTHGNLTMFDNATILHNISNKSGLIYFNFNVDTNKTKRMLCFDSLKNKIEWLKNITPSENVKRLSQYRFCICPEGNGVDTHRLWEALYLKTVPVVIKSDFTSTLQKNNVPLVVLNSWDDFNLDDLNYNTFDFENAQFLKTIDLRKILL
ncbi:MAG: hypothetical protein MUP82_11395 [Candidatus Marinimicrobia bacterium]|nr:hypothetical protein [Candidatus Neomarinimicrobiota bacterium]